MNKKALTESDICDQFITPALENAGWDKTTQIRREVTFTAGRVIVRGKVATRGKQRRADYVLYLQPNLPIAVVEAKDNNNPVGGGMAQAIEYAKALDVPFAVSSNGTGSCFMTSLARADRSRRPSRWMSSRLRKPSGPVTGARRA